MMLEFPRHARSVAEIVSGTASYLTPDISNRVILTPPGVLASLFRNTHGAVLPIFGYMFFQGCCYCCNYILLFPE